MSLVMFGALLGSCNSSSPPSPPASVKKGSGAAESKQFKSFSCTKNQQIAPVPAAQYVDFRRVVNGLSFSLVVHGRPCGGAEGASCASQLAELERGAAARDANVGACVSRRCPENVYALATYGDRPLHVAANAELKKLLGPIDTPVEAWLVAMIDSHVGPFGCDSEDSAAYRKEGEAFILRERWYSKTCNPVELTETLNRVTSTGQVTKIGDHIVSSQPEACVSN